MFLCSRKTLCSNIIEHIENIEQIYNKNLFTENHLQKSTKIVS
jgi:hypothetical protein